MKLLNTYDDREDAEAAAEQLTGERRLASERDGTIVIYNLFGTPNWGNFLRLNMYNLEELKVLLASKNDWNETQLKRHTEIINTLKIVEKNYTMTIPNHWL